ncbi:acyl carrier protein [Thalassotalea marina]|uniref:Carrier domain-containing protein n=1 Tax=Thalassotalea marina TaxID=1673741 RepID=A0A919ELE2_9GAMM|nr:phosphopantetheine-binding protein [Thalassotalea marina]GHF99225.1 hypothetical protein GCM10017161_29530 [Thalassotalea marina]
MTEESVKSTIITILTRLMPSYESNYWSQQPELFGAVPEFDSMTIVNLIGELEDNFDIELDDDDITAENFATVDSVAALIINQ